MDVIKRVKYACRIQFHPYVGRLLRGRFGPDQYDLDIWRAFSSLNLTVPIIPKQEPSRVDKPKEQIVHDVSLRFKRKRQNYSKKETASAGDIDSEPSKFVIDPSMPTSRRRRRYRSVHETNLNSKASRGARRGGSTATAYVKRLAQGHVAHIPKSDSPTKTTTTATTTKGPVKTLSLAVGIQLRPPPYAVGALSVVGIPASTSIGDMIYQIKKKKKIPCATQLVASKNDESLREDETLQSLLDRGILLLNKDDGGGGGDDFQFILRLAQKE